MPVKKLKEFLDANHVKYVSIIHSKVHTAQEVAASPFLNAGTLVQTDGGRGLGSPSMGC